MSLTIQKTEHRNDSGTVIVLVCAGKIRIGDDFDVFRNQIQKYEAPSNNLRVVLNLGGVTHIDAAGIGKIVEVFTNLTNSGGWLRVANVQKKVNDLFQSLKLYNVFDRFETEETAVSTPWPNQKP